MELEFEPVIYGVGVLVLSLIATKVFVMNEQIRERTMNGLLAVFGVGTAGFVLYAFGVFIHMSTQGGGWMGALGMFMTMMFILFIVDFFVRAYKNAQSGEEESLGEEHVM